MKLVSSVLFAVFLPAIAAAQNTGIYIQAGPLADLLFAASADGFPVDVSPMSSSWVSTSLSIGFPAIDVRRSRSRVAPGATAAIGVFITPSVSLRLEGSHQGEHVTTATGDQGALLSVLDRESTATTDVVVATGWHQGGSRRTTITYLGGVVFRRQRDEASLEYTYSSRFLPTTPGQPPILGGLLRFDQEFGATSYSAGVMAGVDVAVRLSRHFAVVPQIRMVAANGALSVRPAVAMRWRP